jgi:purine nucleosidase
MKKVIFDTDIGIDDAMALLFLHFSPAVDLLAIVTGFGNASIENTTRNALYIKELFGIAAPIYRGAARAVSAGLAEEYPDFVHGQNGLGDIAFATPGGEAETVPGAQVIVDLVRQRPQEISIVAVGRMTNLAHALELCPELPSLVGEVVIMGGAFGFNGHSGNVSPVAEANIAGDPVAADRVFASGMPITVVGLDVTEEIVATARFFDDLRDNAGRAGQFIHKISRCYLDFHERINGVYECPIHDSSAVAYLLEPEEFSTQEGSVRVAVDGSNAGQTIFSAESTRGGGSANCRICTGVNAGAVLKLYASTICSGGN